MVDYTHATARVLQPEFESGSCYAAMTCPFPFCCWVCKHFEVTENNLNACSLNKNKWEIVADCCCCQCPTARTTVARLEYLPAIMTNEGWLLPKVHWGRQSLYQLPVSVAVSQLSSVLFTKHLCRTPQALAKKDEKINIYKEEQLPTNYQSRMSYMLEQYGGHKKKTISQILSKEMHVLAIISLISVLHHHLWFQNVGRLHSDSVTFEMKYK